MKLSKKFQEFIYSMSTNDKYSEFDSSKSFNRVNKPEGELLYSHHNLSTSAFIGSNDLSQESNNIDGVHEVRLAWRHIKNWLNQFSPDLNSSLSSPCTTSDIIDFEKDLNIKLPNCLVEFYKLTDGQSNFNENGSGGLIYGLKLMSIDEVVVMTENWRRVAKTLNHELSHLKSINKLLELKKLQVSHNNANSNSNNNSPISLTDPSGNIYSTSASSTSSLDLSHMDKKMNSMSVESFLPAETTPSNNSIIPNQRSIPPGAIHSSFAHPMWIPLIVDDVGNCIGVDLSPPVNANGKWGQIILFGREFDTKYLVASNFGDFLLIFANDLELGNWKIKNLNNLSNDNEDLMIGIEGELVFVNNKIDNNTSGSGEEVSYLEVLKNRCIKNWVSSLSDEDLKKDEIILTLAYLKSQKQLLKQHFYNSKIELNSIDSHINKNLNTIDNLNQPITQQGSSSTSVQSKIKSPLSHEITDKDTNLDASILDSIVEDDSDDDKVHSIPKRNSVRRNYKNAKFI